MWIMKVVFVIKNDGLEVLVVVVLPNAFDLLIIVLLEFLLGLLCETNVQEKLGALVDACFLLSNISLELRGKDCFRGSFLILRFVFFLFQVLAKWSSLIYHLFLILSLILLYRRLQFSDFPLKLLIFQLCQASLISNFPQFLFTCHFASLDEFDL